MLIYNDSRRLGDKILSKEEALLRKYEDTDRQLQRFRLDDHEALKNLPKRMGKVMLHSDLISKIVRMNPRLWAEDSRANPETVVGFYYTNAEGKKAYAVAFDKGPVPEYSFIVTDRADLAVKEVRGWRTVLHRLLKLGLLKWKDVLDTFGDPLHAANERWRINTQEFRQ